MTPARSANVILDIRVETERLDTLGIVGDGVWGDAPDVQDAVVVFLESQGREAFALVRPDALQPVESRRVGRQRDERDCREP
jgi:hypothetical protein